MPGEKIKEELKAWDDEERFEADDIDLWGKEYWQTLRDFERELKKEEKGYEIAYKNLKKRNIIQMNNFRNAACMRMEILETSLIETKLKLK